VSHPQAPQIVAYARALLGTRYVPQARLPGVGIDCAGVPIVVGRALGLVPPDFDVNGYSLFPNGQLLEHCNRHLTPITKAEMKAGDIAIVSWGTGDAQHFGIVADHLEYPGELSLIHASNDARHKKVIEHRLVFGRHMRFVAAYRFPCRS
jgi:cell wall-associated NlpC family hydrolase